ncbi:MAG: Ribosomal RNA large subunit methyltransferase E [Candidatus Methanofastidiosum methylothiophilum]|jgi:23S rRNA (uridine2552-2'-O)-methyltransferase|uniref:Ribosomal RNA large subunit methyltransferase E n=1 Tax=Candidatus Methanofastidiosum methylothiophilum TaxID=1705564 RepID=A0A150JLD8_9EURY|nr:MAG: Ribosomal RNA large subunit methyltransferase E [Candidatus Methanofastidiosum methylthiophilus]MBP6931924.1 RlmE family RNA methyltransferase [Methanofastidiosum sp.]OQC52125.1 MAG: Ribosomal RNA large subunit methyltransferase E [Euryarchaeota archaeon ADurb.Bin023]KYC57152.1 MAG: Ribosomal RNA large subunit methyltransferase E [Candidatus Methanofastidiosum methylthiophilus]KYC57908.1 MAG: Ribosomal RNA large subunit methyltransferase E [Candidatus Methanofastidiosum methylthiophilus
MYQKKDGHYRMAKKEGYKSRASFKLIQLNKKFNLIKKGYCVLDLGAAPGGWMQIASALVGDKGLVVGIDLKLIKDKFPNSYFIQGDIFEENIFKKIKEIKGEYDAIISDLSPKISGIRSLDHQKSIELSYRVLELSSILLQYKGNLLIKIFQGEFTKELIDNLKNEFYYVKISKPESSRSASRETYVICKGYKKRKLKIEDTELTEESA